MIDAGRGGFYVQGFKAGAEGFDPITPPQLIDVGDLQAFGEANQINTLVAPSFQKGQFEDYVKDDSIVGEGLLFVEARAEKLLTIDRRHHIKGADVKALYLRAADAKPQQGKALQRVDQNS